MKKPSWDLKSIREFSIKASLLKEVLKDVTKGHPDNVIDVSKTFERSIYYNNHEMYNKLNEDKK